MIDLARLIWCWICDIPLAASRARGSCRAREATSGIFACSTLCASLLAGCIVQPQHPAATQPATIGDVATTQPGYWYDQPAQTTVVALDFDRSIEACKRAIRQFGFKVDRVDYREGLVTSRPMVSSQFFELWRSDVQSIKDSREASMRTTRRTLRFEIARRSDDQCALSVKVLVERLSVAEQRITNVALYHGTVARVSPREQQRGTKELDEGIQIPSRYWYATGRDPALEKKLARDIEQRLSRERNTP